MDDYEDGFVDEEVDEVERSVWSDTSCIFVFVFVVAFTAVWGSSDSDTDTDYKDKTFQRGFCASDQLEYKTTLENHLKQKREKLVAHQVWEAEHPELLELCRKEQEMNQYVGRLMEERQTPRRYNQLLKEMYIEVENEEEDDEEEEESSEGAALVTSHRIRCPCSTVCWASSSSSTSESSSTTPTAPVTSNPPTSPFSSALKVPFSTNLILPFKKRNPRTHNNSPRPRRHYPNSCVEDTYDPALQGPSSLQRWINAAQPGWRVLVAVY
ncbi:hypothetical protein BGZ47_005483 [Haplosporangium gracile]|nr:hypothetical protein BGZ47_005483 [Haplosporangium gracile]